MESNVAENPDVDLVEHDAQHLLTGESGQCTTADPEARVEEIKHMGIRSEQARHVGEAERSLNLPEEEDELNRIRASALLKSKP